MSIGSPLSNAGGIILTELSPIRKLNELNLLFSCKAEICYCSKYHIE